MATAAASFLAAAASISNTRMAAATPFSVAISRARASAFLVKMLRSVIVAVMPSAIRAAVKCSTQSQLGPSLEEKKIKEQ